MLNNFLLCKPKEEKEVKSGFIIEELAEKFKELTVVESKEEDIPKGSRVLVHKTSGDEHEIEGKKHSIIRRGDIVSIL